MSTSESTRPRGAGSQAAAGGSRARPRLSNIGARILTGLILLPLILVGALLGGMPWALIALGIGLLALLEFYALIWRALRDEPARLALAGLAGLAYIGGPLVLLVMLRAQPGGFAWLMLVFGITAGCDTLAYVGGGLFGRRPLAPALSPRKTTEGALIGAAGGAGIALAFLAAAGALHPASIAAALLGPLVAIAGDLLESAIKRALRAKDSHIHGLNVVPGHGGVLDRIDSLLLVTPFACALLWAGGLITF
jgi:phosphatidate cytidylyltransferase